MDDFVPRTTQQDELAALTSILTPEGTQFAPEPEYVAPLTPTAALAATEAPAPTEAPQAPASPPTPIAETLPAPVTPEAVPTFRANFDEDQRALLDEPDFDEEARLEVAAGVEDGEYEYADPETAAKLKAQQKRIDFLEGQVVAKSKKGWIEEAKRACPDLARLIPGEIEGIQASSRRAFLREAAARNTKYAAVLAPTLAKLEADRAAIAAGAVATAREEVADAWGRPAADTLPPIAAAQQEALAKARATGDLQGAIKVLMNDTPVL